MNDVLIPVQQLIDKLQKGHLKFLSDLYYNEYLGNTEHQNIEFGEFVENYLADNY